jgi:hypothetical protein
MAGYIYISAGVGCGMGSHHFREIVMLVRECFLAGEEGVAEELFEYYDETGDCLITFKGKGKKEVNAFYRALVRAAENARNSDELINFGVVEEILEKLRGDPRFEG